jgi:tRNA(Ile)-lysidine synthetase-like protein
MEFQLKPGKYVVAVSGGVDSVSLLHALQAMTGVELVVAHFDHGIRPDSGQDHQFVDSLAATYELPFVSAEGKLGAGASEAIAREARYEFLERVRGEQTARAIVTAHHQDDVVETAIINILRGTGRKGLSSLASRQGIERPLLKIPKQQILEYARQNGLDWREDSSNADETYLRNHVRRNLLPKFSVDDRRRFVELLDGAGQTNAQLDTLLVKYLSPALDRQSFNDLPHDVALEVMAAWLRQHGLRDFDRRTLDRLVIAAKTAQPGRRFDILHTTSMEVGKADLALVDVER